MFTWFIFILSRNKWIYFSSSQRVSAIRASLKVLELNKSLLEFEGSSLQDMLK